MEGNLPKPESESDQAFRQAEQFARLARQQEERADDLGSQGHGDSGRTADAQEYAEASEAAQVRGGHAKKAELDVAEVEARQRHDLPLSADSDPEDYNYDPNI